MFQRLKKVSKVFKKMAYTRKPIKINKIYCKGCLGGRWQSKFISLISFVLNICVHCCV